MSYQDVSEFVLVPVEYANKTGMCFCPRCHMAVLFEWDPDGVRRGRVKTREGDVTICYRCEAVSVARSGVLVLLDAEARAALGEAGAAQIAQALRLIRSGVPDAMPVPKYVERET